MKKIFSISFAFLILISGIHLSFATHFCGRDFSSHKWSLTGLTASCGMETPEESCPMQKGIGSSCCRNEMVTLAIDNNFNPSNFQSLEVIKKITLFFATPRYLIASTIGCNITSYLIIPPPIISICDDVSLSKICVFRI